MTFNRNDYFHTSKGLRHRSQIFAVKGGSHVRRSKGAAQVRSRESETWQTMAISPLAAQDQGGWISWTDWRDTTQNQVSSFAASWRVPPAPDVAGGQLIYLFNGLQDANGQHIIQPVLQWGSSPAQGSGTAWGIASFWVGQPTDPMFCTEWVAVDPGIMITGRMIVTPQDNGLFSCTCQFDNYSGTQLTAEELPALIDCVLTLEAYDTGPSAPYPNIPNTGFTSVEIATGPSTPAVQWTTYGGAKVAPDGSIQVVYPTGMA